ncbi:SDR family oxidoreductase [Myxosarcina sp. GI1]|uniref:SDR family oxidoreductase n=1 Tax=Myxosarcina sp. GI1 TaxID=1541065 RepID=UPI00055C3847|nr:SDR family oxidoreductase [Myxosarcina sp. GI1]
MKIAIIGCGYVGSAIARLWQRQGHQVTVTTTTPEKISKLETIADCVVLAKGNDLETLQKLVSDREMVLLSVGAKSRTIDNYRQSYLETAKNVVKAIETAPSVKQLIYTGSYAVLGDKNGAWTDETAPVNPANEHGEILCQTESELLSVPENQMKSSSGQRSVGEAFSERVETSELRSLKVCILRLAGIYGEGRELIKIFGRVAGTTRPGSGDDYTNWIHLDDIVGAIEFARQRELSGIYNLASDEILTTKEFLDRLFKVHERSPVNWDDSQTSVRPYNTKLSNQKLKNAGFRLAHPQLVF